VSEAFNNVIHEVDQLFFQGGLIVMGIPLIPWVVLVGSYISDLLLIPILSSRGQLFSLISRYVSNIGTVWFP